MSSVNVLAVMAAAASRMEVSGAPRYAERVKEARAAVAELIEAAEQMAEATGGDRCRCRANLRAALARVQVGAA